MALLTVPGTATQATRIRGDNTTAGAVVPGAVGVSFEVIENCTLTHVDAQVFPSSGGGLRIFVYEDSTQVFLGAAHFIAHEDATNITLVPGKTYTVGVYQSNPGTGNLLGAGLPTTRQTYTLFLGDIDTEGEHYRSVPGPPINGSLYGFATGTHAATPATGATADRFWGNWILSFTNSISQQVTTPERPLVYSNSNQFNIAIPVRWRIRDLLQWELQRSQSTDNAHWSDWETLGIQGSPDEAYVDSNLSPDRYYKYRYQVRTLLLESNWSDEFYAGLGGTTIIGIISGEGGAGDGGGSGSGTILYGSGAPADSLGTVGDFYYDTTGHYFYGPKT